MSNLNQLFFELIRVAIGTQESLSRLPSETEWEKLFDMAVKQSLVGVCFAGIHSIGADTDDGFAKIGMSEDLFFNWMGMATQINMRNDVVNEKCVALQKLLTNDGFRSCVLKGQGVSMLYGEDLRGFRQSGDIDMWMLAESEKVIEWARATGSMYYYDYHHADLSLFEDTEIELHYRPSLSRNLVRNARLQKWFREEGVKHVVYNEDLGFFVPDYVLNVVMTMNHNFWHLLYEGVGMRQFMDLYFILKSRDIDDSRVDTCGLLKHLKLERFASASMWILKDVFGLADEYLLCEPDERTGHFLLDEIMQAGNFGKHDERLKNGRYKNRLGLMLTWIRHSFRLFKYYPADVLWTPIGVLRISLWRRWHYRKENGRNNKK